MTDDREPIDGPLEPAALRRHRSSRARTSADDEVDAPSSANSTARSSSASPSSTTRSPRPARLRCAAGLADYDLDDEDLEILEASDEGIDGIYYLPALPVLAIVGRPNVGKSALVNRIIGRREAVVEDTPGVTRDRVSYKAEWLGRRFTVVDTGGWEPDAKGINASVAAQAEVAVDLADAVLFVVDINVGATATDEHVVRMLRASKRPVILVANKADDAIRDPQAAELWSLGLGEPWPVSRRARPRRRRPARPRHDGAARGLGGREGGGRRTRVASPCSAARTSASRACSTRRRARSASSSTSSPAPRAIRSTSWSRSAASCGASSTRPASAAACTCSRAPTSTRACAPAPRSRRPRSRSCCSTSPSRSASRTCASSTSCSSPAARSCSPTTSGICSTTTAAATWSARSSRTSRT